jgi:hypothetical protein
VTNPSNLKTTIDLLITGDGFIFRRIELDAEGVVGQESFHRVSCVPLMRKVTKRNVVLV